MGDVGVIFVQVDVCVGFVDDLCVDDWVEVLKIGQGCQCLYDYWVMGIVGIVGFGYGCVVFIDGDVCFFV